MGNSRVFFPFGVLTLFVLIITGIVCLFSGCRWGWGVPNISTNNLLYALFASDAMMWAVCGFGRWTAMA